MLLHFRTSEGEAATWLIFRKTRDSAPECTPRRGRHRFSMTVRSAVYLISLILIVGTLLPASVRASVFGDFWATLRGAAHEESSAAPSTNLQTMQLLKPAMNVDPAAARGGGDVTIVDDSALVPEEGPSGTMADIEKPKNSTISTYVVRSGDTLSEIAEMFGVSPNTILWANDLPRGAKLRIGQKLTILPVTGLRYTVKKGDTLASIAKKYHGDAAEIASYNGIDEGGLAIGLDILIPDGEVPVVIAHAPARATGSGSVGLGASGTPTQVGYYSRPIGGGVRSQGIHGYNGVDLAAPRGTPILASAGGEVIIAKGSGWNGGYGSYIVVQHSNGSQTLYAHASSVAVSAGENVTQGQVIGYVGSTGKSTGSHLHFEIRNGIRNPF